MQSVFETAAGHVFDYRVRHAFPPHCMDARVLDQELFMRKCDAADDVWLKFMQLKKGRRRYTCRDRDFWSCRVRRLRA